VLDEGRVGDAVIATSDLVLNGPFSHGLVPVAVPEWWLSRETAGGGALIDLGYHLIDLLNWMFGDLEVVHSSLGHRLNLAVEDTGTVLLKSKKTATACVVNVGWFMRSIFPEYNFRVNIHGTGGYATTENYAPKNLRAYAAKEGAMNILRRVTGRKVHFLSWTYYYSSFYTILELFFEAIRKGAEFPISLDSQLEVARVIDSIYSEHGVL
jgi:predicted dehydrogenase